MNSLDRFTITESKVGDARRKFKSVQKNKPGNTRNATSPTSKMSFSNTHRLKALAPNLFEVFDTNKQQEELEEFQSQMYSRIEVNHNMLFA